MDSVFLRDFCELLAAYAVRVARFNFPYMQKTQEDGRRRLPDRLPVLLDHWRATWERVQAEEPGHWAVGGRSMGGRMASMLADELRAPALVCLGYPFHPAGKPAHLRIAHLQVLQTPALIIQGERDAFGWRQEVGNYQLPANIQIGWLPSADHDFRPLKSSGLTQAMLLDEAARQVADFLQSLQA